MSTRTRRRQTAKNLARASQPRDKAPLVEHLRELRRRLFIVGACVSVGSLIAYGSQKSVIAILLRPSHGQHFIYTSPLGGINFLFSVCLDIGIVLSIPIIVYQLLRFLEPLMRETTKRFIFIGSLLSGAIGAVGILFGYFIGLPSALHFLLNQFTSAQIKPLITIQSYMTFVTVYLLASALMFQLPLLMIFTNRIKPLRPSSLLRYERHVVVSSFIVGFIMNPTPNLIDQMLVVGPIVIMYQVGILLIWFINRGRHPSAIRELLEKDQLLQSDRASRATRLVPIIQVAPELDVVSAVVPVLARPSSASRGRRYIDDYAAPPTLIRGAGPSLQRLVRLPFDEFRP